jgi:muramoyltetrapeptide carboxypeptidase
LKTIHLIAPSGASLDAKSPLLGMEWLRAQGIQIENVTCVERVSERFAGTDLERLAELNQIAQLAPQKLVMVMRGGYGIHRLLPNIEWSAIAKAIENDLQVCGHSDFTAFSLALLAKTGAVTLSGPMLNYDFGRVNDDGQAIPPNEFMWEHFQRAVDQRRLDCEVLATQAYLGSQPSDSISGILWGGNLTVITSLIGTPYMPTSTQTQGGILFLEDVNEHPYRIERMLMQLLDTGILKNQAAILLGGFSAYRLYDNDRGYSLESAIKMIRSRLPSTIPILTGLPFGHQADKLTLPVGIKASLAYSADRFKLSAQW